MTERPDFSCKPDCPECGGNGFLRGDTQSGWSCTLQAGRYMKHYKLGPWAEKKDARTGGKQ